jgi:GrpB-like predicted nucleotidyltransferase (UPF0157 family)
MNKRSDQVEFVGSALGHVHLSEPKAEWARLFESERQRLVAISPGRFKNIAHFGSTAVPGLRAKPIIDIMASVEALSTVDAMMPTLLSYGYAPVDVGFVKRRFLRKQLASSSVGYHLHIITNAAWPNKNELLVRDWLIAHPDVAACYETLKQALARKHPDDRPAYTAAKSEFLRTVVNDARQSRGLPPESDWAE